MPRTRACGNFTTQRSICREATRRDPVIKEKQKQVREMQIPIYSCPSDLPQLYCAQWAGRRQRLLPDGSYRGNAGRNAITGRSTWYLGEDIAELLIPTNWRGPLHAVVKKDSPF